GDEVHPRRGGAGRRRRRRGRHHGDGRARGHGGRAGPRARADALRPGGVGDRAPARGRAPGVLHRGTIGAMKMILRKSERAPDAGDEGTDVTGPARVGTRTKDLTKRLRPGDVAVIDHVDIDRVAADALVAVGPAAVLNAARSTSGRYPNAGPGILVEAGITLVDDLGPAVMALPEG